MVYSILIAIGAATVAIGVVILVISILARDRKSSTEKQKEQQHLEAGGVIFLGPIPIIFGSNRRIAKWMVLAALALGVLMVTLLLLSGA